MITHVKVTITSNMLGYLIRNTLGVADDAVVYVTAEGADEDGERGILLDDIEAIHVKVETDLKGATKIEKRLAALTVKAGGEG